MRRYTNHCEGAINGADAHGLVNNSSQIARLGNRVLMTAQNEADNSEEPSFVSRVRNAADQLHNGEFKIFENYVKNLSGIFEMKNEIHKPGGLASRLVMNLQNTSDKFQFESMSFGYEVPATPDYNEDMS